MFHYRDDTGLEADAILERDDGAWVAVEVKLSHTAAVVDQPDEPLAPAAAQCPRLRSVDVGKIS